MKFLNIFKDLSLERKDCLYLSILLIYNLIITFFMINFNQDLGVYCSDVYIYLYNSLVFARIAFNANYLYLSPLICFLTSLLFRLGHVGETSIFIVTGLFSIFGSIGIYAMLKRYFTSLLSITGAVLFTSFSLNLLWWANGTLDIPAGALSIWAVLFLILAIDENPKIFLLSFPLLILGVFTRYTCLFLIPLFLFYYLSKHDFFDSLDLLISDRKEAFLEFKSYLGSAEFKYILASLLLSVLVLAIFIYPIIYYGTNLSFFTQGSSFASGSKGAVMDSAYTLDTLFYLHDFLNFLFSQKVVFDGVIPNLIGASYLSYIILAIILVGIIILIFRLSKAFNNYGIVSNPENDNEGSLKSRFSGYFQNYRTKHFDKFLIAVFILSFIITILGFKINSLITISFLLICLVVIFSLLMNKGFNRGQYSVPLLMIAWFLVYFIFFTFIHIKVNRYIITVFPAFIYFVVLALNEILNLLDEKEVLNIGNFNLSNLIPVVLIILCMFSAFSFTSTFEHDLDFNEYKVVADYLIQYDDDYASKNIAAFKQRHFNWLLKDSTIPITTDQIDFLESSNITYYICDEDLKMENYTKIYNYKDIFLYERINNIES